MPRFWGKLRGDGRRLAVGQSPLLAASASSRAWRARKASRSTIALTFVSPSIRAPTAISYATNPTAPPTPPKTASARAGCRNAHPLGCPTT